jgi:hypothetical protein
MADLTQPAGEPALVPPEPTLGALLRAAAREQLPRRFYRVLHLAIPVALQFGELGWWRPAAWMVVVSAFGAWGLCEHRTFEASTMGWKRPWSRVGRFVAGLVGGSLFAGLLLELFLRVLGGMPPQG